MKLTKKLGALLVAGLVPVVFALAQSPGDSSSSQPATMGSGHMMGNQMMPFNNQVSDLLAQLQENLSSLESEGDVAAIHKQVSQNLDLVEQLRTTLNGHCGMSMGPMGSHMQQGQMMHPSNGNMMGGQMSGSNMPHHGSANASDQQQ